MLIKSFRRRYLAGTIAIACMLSATVLRAQQFDLLPDVQPGPITIDAHVLTSSLPVEMEFLTEVFTQRVGPTDLVEVPNGTQDLVVTTYGGFAFRMDSQEHLQASPFLDLRSETSSSHNPNFEIGGAHGFTAIAFHPHFAVLESPAYGRFYTLEPERLDSGKPDFVLSSRPGRHHDDVLYEYTLPSSDDVVCDVACVASKRELMRVLQPDWHHNLGDLAFDTDGLLYIASADGSTSNKNPPFMSDNAQSLNTIFGKILRIDPLGSNSTNGRYGIPTSNPFVDSADGALNEIYAYGFRNPYRISFDSATGQLFATDTGELRIESAYRVQAGGNHGWNLKEGSMIYDKTTKLVTPDVDADNSGIGDVAEANGLVEPIFEYDRDFGRSIIGTVLYRGDEMADLQGSLVFGDFTGRLYYGDLATGIEYEFELAEESDPLPYQLHSVNEDLDGNLYVLGIQRNGPDFQGVVVRIDAPLTFSDCNADGDLDAVDLACVTTIGERDALLAALHTLPGDLDGNGDVSFADFLVLSKNFGQNLPNYTDGNIDLTDTVDFADFLVLSTNFGRTPGEMAAVPEPNGIAMIWLGLLCAIASRRRVKR